MNVSKFISSLFIFLSFTASAQQIDSNAQKTLFSISEKQAIDTTQSDITIDKEKPPFKKHKKVAQGKNTNIHQRGIGSGNPETNTKSTSEIIQYFEFNIQELKKENTKLINRIEKLKDENEKLKQELNSTNQDEGDSSTNKNNFTVPPTIIRIIFVFLFLFIVIYIVYRNRKFKIHSLLEIIAKYSEAIQRQRQSPQAYQNIFSPPSKIIETKSPKINNVTPQEIFPKSTEGVKSFSNVEIPISKNIFSSHSDNWFIVGASAIGKSHITSNKPCQDNHYCGSIGNGWGIAISCDGAGSADYSDLGSEFVAKDAYRIFKEFIENNGYHNKNILPSDNEWNLIAKEAFNQIYKNLEIFAKSRGLETNSVACTIIVIIYSPSGLLVAHLGDGRAGYCNEDREWKSAMIPHKGEEANQTIFISTTAWQNDNSFLMSGVPVPESRVIRERPIAFTLMSDGCEAHSFECSKMDATTNKWHDPNSPFPNFFNPLVEHLRELSISKVSIADANAKWRKFVEEGTQGIKDESDDKTLILGIRI